MGWSYDDHTELFSMEELIEKFSIEKLNPSPAAVNYSKLDHFNGVYIRSLSVNELQKRIEPFYAQAGIETSASLLNQITPLIQERIRTLDEAVQISSFFFQDEVHPDPQDLIGKNLSASESADAAREAQILVETLSSFEIEPLEAALRDLADQLELKPGQLFGILRIAVTGQRVSPPLIETMVILGRETVLKRVAEAVNLLERLNDSS